MAATSTTVTSRSCSAKAPSTMPSAIGAAVVATPAAAPVGKAAAPTPVSKAPAPTPVLTPAAAVEQPAAVVDTGAAVAKPSRKRQRSTSEANNATTKATTPTTAAVDAATATTTPGEEKAGNENGSWLIVAKSVRTMLKNMPENVHCSADALPMLNSRVQELLHEAAARAAGNSRKTLKPCDF